MSARLTGVSPNAIARGLIAACDHFKVDPTDCTGHGAAANARAAVGAALVAIMPRRGPKDGAVLAVGTLLQVNPTYMCPAGLRQRNINTELLLDLAEVMKAAGLDPTAIRVERSRINAAKPKVEAPAKAQPAAPTPTTLASVTRAAAKTNTKMQTPAGETIRSTPGRRMEAAPVTAGSAQGAASPSRPANAQPTVVQLPPMKPKVRRWTRQFLNAGWSPREVAWLFNLAFAQVKAVKLEASHG